MAYVNKIKKNDVEADIQDVRIVATASDVGKVLTVDAQGDLVFETPSGGGGSVHCDTYTCVFVSDKLYGFKLQQSNYDNTVSSFFAELVALVSQSVIEL